MGFGTMERREKVKRLNWVLLMGAVLLAGFSSFAVCPPGSIPVDQWTPPPAAWIAGAIVTIPADTTMCVRGDIVLGAGAWLGLNQIVLLANSRVVGDHPGVTVTGDGTAVVIFTLAGNGATLEGFRILQGPGAGETHAVQILAAANDCVVRNMTISDDVNGAGSWATAAVEVLGGLNHSIQANTFWVYGFNVTPPNGIISVQGGVNIRVVDNRINVDSTPAAAWNPVLATIWPINVVGGNAHEILRNQITTNVAPEVAQIRVLTVQTVVRDNVITFNNNPGSGIVGGVADGAVGIFVNAAMCQVVGNQIRNPGGFYLGGTGPATGASTLAGIWIGPAGFNAVVEDNRVTGCGYDTPVALGVDRGSAVIVQAPNVTVRNNFLQTAIAQFGAVNTTFVDDAAGVYVDLGAVNAQVIGNTINSATSGIVVGAPNATVRNNTITDAATGADAALVAAWAVPACGISVYAVGATIENNTVLNVSNAGQDTTVLHNGGHGVGLFGGLAGYFPPFPGSLNAQVRNNTLRSAARHGVSVEAATSIGNVIEGNTIELANNNGVNINVASNNNIIRNNTIRACGNSGIFVNNGALNTQILNNTLVDNGSQGSPPVAPTVSEALVVSGGSNNSEVRGNTITTTVTLPENRGIRVEACTNVTVDNNTIRNTSPTTLTHGIVIETGTMNCTFSNNKIENMQEFGIVIRGGSATLGRVDVTGNSLINNAVGILFDGGAANVTCNLIWGGSDGIRISAGIPVNNHTFRNNAIYSPIRARNLGVSTFNAQQNYWGDPAGAPAKTVFGPVDTSNWLTSHPTCAPQPPAAPTPSGLSKNYGARAGWYMVSVPTTGDTAGIFGVTLYWWNGTSYTSLNGTAAIEPVKGYWANLPANKTVTASGSIPTTDQTVALVKGWNMISVPWAYPKAAIQVQKGTETKSWADAVAAGWVRDTIWGYDGAYQSVTTLDPWYGYWVRALVDGLSLKFAYASRLTTLCVSCLEAKAVVPEGEELPPAPPAASAAEFTFVNVPNPIRDVHTTTFKVLGPLASMVTEIKVQVFDLTGKLVWEGTASGAELTWHTDDLTGAYLANGVYLYKVYVKVGDAWISSGVLKLVIQR